MLKIWFKLADTQPFTILISTIKYLQKITCYDKKKSNADYPRTKCRRWCRSTSKKSIRTEKRAGFRPVSDAGWIWFNWSERLDQGFPVASASRYRNSDLPSERWNFAWRQPREQRNHRWRGMSVDDRRLRDYSSGNAAGFLTDAGMPALGQSACQR